MIESGGEPNPTAALVDVRGSCVKPPRLPKAEPVLDAWGFEIKPAKEASRARLRRLRSTAAQCLHGQSPVEAHADQVRGKFYSVTACGKVPSCQFPSMILTQKVSGRVDAMGILRCGSVWTCPECIQRVAVQRGRDVMAMIEAMRGEGHFLTMNTYTLPHDATTTCAQAFENIKGAIAAFGRDQTPRRIMKAAGFVGRARVVEVTWSPSSGWHVHIHEVAVWAGLGGMSDESSEGDRLTAETLAASLKASWNRASIAITGRQAHSTFGLDMRPVWSANDYVAKMPEKAVAKIESGKKRWGADAELSAMQMKDGKGDSMSYLNLLDAADLGSRQAVMLVREYAAASFGRRQFEWTRTRSTKEGILPGLRQLAGLDAERDDEEVAAAEPDWVFEDEIVGGDQSHLPLHRVEIPASDAWRARATGGRHSIDRAVRAVECHESTDDEPMPNLAHALARQGWTVEKTRNAHTRTESVFDERKGEWQERHTFEPNLYTATWPRLTVENDPATMSGSDDDTTQAE